MKQIYRKIALIFLALLMLFGALPASVMESLAAPSIYTLGSEFIKVEVSRDNGGFVIRTVEGDRLNKDDQNKDLLYHSGEYDTSFISFQVQEPGQAAKEYIFGGKYGLLPSLVTTTQDDTGITAEWSVDGYVFTERIELSNPGSQQHGSVIISLKAKNTNSTAATIKARLLMDTALGSSDTASYELVNSVNTLRRVDTERVFTQADYIPDNFFAYDDPASPGITAYSLAGELKPYQLAFAHWNNLASTVFDFTADTALNFTNAQNGEFLTADSAMALYYDLGSLPAGGEAQLSTNYGVYSNAAVEQTDYVAINTNSPMTLELNSAKTAYVSPIDGAANGKFKVETSIQNYSQAGAQTFERVAVAVYPGTGIIPLDSYGNALPKNYSRSDPYVIYYDDFVVGQTQLTNFFFKADVSEGAEYRRIELKVFNMTESAQGNLVQQNLIGSKSLYLLCPGSNGKVPEITFTGAQPEISYYKGNRHIYLAGSNINLLEDTSRYTMKLKPAAGGDAYVVPTGNILFPEDQDNVLDLYLKDELAEGSYQLEIDWAEGLAPSDVPDPLTAPLLNLEMSSDMQYKTDAYGILAILQVGEGTNSKYELKTYQTEAAYIQDTDSHGGTSPYEEVIMTLRGEFSVEDDPTTKELQYTAVSVKTQDPSGKSKVDNMVTINNCIDFEDGSMTITKKASSILVDFDGALYSSVERTSIWKGIACFTAINNGTDYDLIKFNRNGERITPCTGDPVCLLWPSALGVAQKLGGLIFNLSYCKLGVMYDTATKLADENLPSPMGYLATYSANLDLGFIIPSNRAEDELEPSAWQKIKEKLKIYDSTTAQMRFAQAMRSYDPTYNDKNPKDTDGQASVMVEDILFGCGKGFIGFRCNVTVTIPGYIDAMPNITGKLSINTVGAWQVGLEGKCKFTTIEFEARLKLKSHNNVPIPDSLYFYVTGLTEPGISVDPFGVVWITGGGGGFENLYNTLFVKSSVPPLRLLLSLNLGILYVFTGRADVSIGLRGLSFRASNVRLDNTEIVVIPQAQFVADWYPQAYVLASVSMKIMDIIYGAGYIVADERLDTYEACAKVSVAIPDAVPLAGGMKVGSVTVGANTEKLWGTLEVISIRLGVTYYWADNDISFGTRGNTTSPTYPELLPIGAWQPSGRSTLPGYTVPLAVYHDEENDRTLYMQVGGNVSHVADAVVAPRAGTMRLGASRLGYLTTNPVLQSDLNRTSHKLNLHGDSAAPRLLQIGFAASSLADAKEKATRITIENTTGDVAYTLMAYDEAKNNAATCNLNVTYDDAGTGYATVAFTGDNSYQKEYSISTPVASNLSMYEVQELPNLTGVSAVIVDSTVNINYAGTKLDGLDSVSFYLTQDKDDTAEGIASAGIYLGKVDTAIPGNGGNKEFQLPSGLASGDYYIRAVASKEDNTNQVVYSVDAVHFTNSNTPDTPQNVVLSQKGDLVFGVKVTTPATLPDAYLLNVYEHDAATGKDILTDVNNIVVEKNEDGTMPELSVGGSYAATGENEASIGNGGLQAGKTYKVGVTALNYVKDVGGKVISAVQSGEALSDSTPLRAVTSVTVTASANTPSVMVERKEWVAGGTAGQLATVKHETFTENTFNMTLTASEEVIAELKLNGEKLLVDPANADSYKVNGSSVTVPFAGLTEGDYMLELAGTNTAGDSFRFTKQFTVDTLPPALMISSPVPGSAYPDTNLLTVVGVTDPDALLTVNIDGVDVAQKKTLAELGATVDASGVFTLELDMGEGNALRNILMIAEDGAGNLASREFAVQNAGLGNIQRYEIVYSTNISGSGAMNWQALTEGNLPLNGGSAEVVLAVRCKTAGGREFILNDPALVQWNANAAAGDITIDRDGYLHAPAGSVGAVVAQLLVATVPLTVAATVGAEVFVNNNINDPVPDGGFGGGAQFELLYHANGGSGRMEDPYSPYYYMAKVTVMKNTFTRAGYRFTGFNTEMDGSGVRYKPGEEFFITEDTLLYAQWKKRSAADDAAESPLPEATGAAPSATQPPAEVMGAPTTQPSDENPAAPVAAQPVEAVKTKRALSWLPWAIAGPVVAVGLYLLLRYLKKRYF